jgi:hypothetical protein
MHGPPDRQAGDAANLVVAAGYDRYQFRSLVRMGNAAGGARYGRDQRLVVHPEQLATDDVTSGPLKGFAMLYTLVVILVVLWLLGAFVVPIGGGLIHLLLVVAVVVLIFQLVSGRRAL